MRLQTSICLYIYTYIHTYGHVALIYNRSKIDLFWQNYVVVVFVDNKIKKARKPGKKQKENPVVCTGEGKRLKGNIREW